MSDDLSPVEQRILLQTAKFAKEELTDSAEVQLEVLDWQGLLTREQMHSLIDGLIDKTLRACKRSLRDAGLAKSQIGDVILVGGSTRTPEWVLRCPSYLVVRRFAV